LEDEVDGSAKAHRFHLRGDVGEDTALRGDGEARACAIDKVQQVNDGAEAVGDGVDTDDGVAGAKHEAVDDGRRDAGGRVGGVIGLQTRGEATGQADGAAESCDDRDFPRDQYQVLQTHQFGDGGGHLGRQAGSEVGQVFGGRRVGEQPVPQIADGETGNRRECG
jgi:hypothetical protein